MQPAGHTVTEMCKVGFTLKELYAGGYAAAKPQRVTRGSDGVVYDPDQYDPDANQRSR